MEKRNRTAGVLFSVLFYLLLAAMIVGSTMFAFSNNESKSIFGYRFYTVLSDSMRTELAKGDMLIVKLSDPDDIKIGDVVTFNPGNIKDAYLTHRVVGFTDNRSGVPGNYIITRGDANNTDDPPTLIEHVIGKKVFRIPFVGSVIRFIQENFIPMLIVIVGLFLLAMILKSYFGKTNPAIATEENKDTQPFDDISRPV